MTTYEIEYIRTGRVNETDKVVMHTEDPIEFEHGIEVAHDITQIIELFEIIAEKWWGTYENRHSIVNIKKLDR